MKAQTLAARIAAKLTTKGGAIAKKFQDVEKVLLGGRHYDYTTIEGLRLKYEYTAVEYPLNDFNNRIEINYNDIVK